LLLTIRPGGHAGKISPKELITLLTTHCTIPVISAGGIAFGKDIKEVMSWGAAGVSVGTIFMASEEAPISADYKQALIDYGAKDIVMTSKLSGSPLTVINTPYVQQLGTEANWLERLLQKNKSLKKVCEAVDCLEGYENKLRKPPFGATYQTVWCAGPAIEHVHNVRSMKEIVKQLTLDLQP
jgi:nitronate monooxygenase